MKSQRGNVSHVQAHWFRKDSRGGHRRAAVAHGLSAPRGPDARLCRRHSQRTCGIIDCTCRCPNDWRWASGGWQEPRSSRPGKHQYARGCEWKRRGAACAISCSGSGNIGDARHPAGFCSWDGGALAGSFRAALLTAHDMGGFWEVRSHRRALHPGAAQLADNTAVVMQAIATASFVALVRADVLAAALRLHRIPGSA